ncbi:MAG: bifunctional riboflavin kinase/FAD synthetase [Candidatus Sumerlaeota bacterium]|nr:bifunctional riboflavin kinase/FAD synthetase [Candidatus Sumerlaeota bacterium]
MRVFRSLDEPRLAAEGKPVALAFGSFDGLHRAHRALIRRVREQAQALGGVSAVLSFSNHPLSVLAPPYAPRLLLSPERKVEILRQLGVDVAILPEFTRDLSHIAAKRFIHEFLVGRLGLRHIVCGYDCRFGAGGQGDGAMLRDEGRRLGFTAEVFEAVRGDGAIIGSQLIRDLLAEGEAERAARLLERPHELAARVVSGERRGRRLGFPTANLEFSEEYVIPANGVYAVWVDVRHARYGGMINLGMRPTFGRLSYVPEVHLFHFREDMYGEAVTVYFLRRLRSERRFPDAEALIRQLRRDRANAQKALRAFAR